VTVLAVIPARRGSTRLADKPLRLLGGVPLVVRVWDRVRSSGIADTVVVATDDAEVLSLIHHAGGDAVLTHAEHPSGTDRVAEVARRTEFRGASIVLNVQGDEPFVATGALEGAVAVVRAGLPIGTAAVPADAECLASPACVKVVCDDAGRALYFSRAPIPFLRDATDAPLRDAHIRQHLGVYAYEPSALQHWVSLPVHPLEQIERLEQLRPLAAGLAIGVALTEPALMGGIDTEDDLARANALWDAHSSAWSIA
jgi:3-deoxy-manno-octulosonate cytidylyltransferase (CMP-KDO synthetase)